MDFATVVRQGFLFLHTVSFAIALSAVLREDVALARARCINARRLSDTARTVTYALIVLWVTGLALVGFNVGLDVRALIADPKLAAKICVVSVLTANGLALHALAFPISAHSGPETALVCSCLWCWVPSARLAGYTRHSLAYRA